MQNYEITDFTGFTGGSIGMVIASTTAQEWLIYISLVVMIMNALLISKKIHTEFKKKREDKHVCECGGDCNGPKKNQ